MLVSPFWVSTVSGMHHGQRASCNCAPAVSITPAPTIVLIVWARGPDGWQASRPSATVSPTAGRKASNREGERGRRASCSQATDDEGAVFLLHSSRPESVCVCRLILGLQGLDNLIRACVCVRACVRVCVHGTSTRFDNQSCPSSLQAVLAKRACSLAWLLPVLLMMARL